MDEEFLCDTPELTRRASNIAKSELLQKRTVEFLLTIASFINGHITDVITKAGNVTVQQRGFSRTIGTTNDYQAIGLLRRSGQMGHQQGILLGMKNL
jgi:hypothetical protein